MNRKVQRKMLSLCKKHDIWNQNFIKFWFCYLLLSKLISLSAKGIQNICHICLLLQMYKTGPVISHSLTLSCHVVLDDVYYLLCSRRNFISCNTTPFSTLCDWSWIIFWNIFTVNEEVDLTCGWISKMKKKKKICSNLFWLTTIQKLHVSSYSHNLILLSLSKKATITWGYFSLTVLGDKSGPH